MMYTEHNEVMRHTVTLEPDVDAAIAEACRVSGKPFKEVVNSILRQGLAQRSAAQAAPSLILNPLKMGLRPGISLVSISGIEALIEEEARG
jgi:hypothetical protein